MYKTMSAFVPIHLWNFIEENKDLLKPPVNNKVIWKDAELMVQVIGGPNKRRDFHVDPSEEVFYQIKGDCYVEVMNSEGKREVVTVKEGEMFLLPPNVPHSPHRVSNTIGIVIERSRAEGELEDFIWFCDQCNHEMHRVTVQLTNIEIQVKEAINGFNNNLDLRTCKNCGYVMPPEASEWKCE
ncbi:3-hydroxyanthranilate 3,4-dioxygenase [Aneurinibacillus thermoaerophilus]|uniref:3-hydroxyanthranilate 3,4-dioxygenase n=2 Tax=Aneurinibacillus thermoaerophilus TaxID=143495 RepID=A0ABX8YEL4_ANETH|nr:MULTISPECIES: 3-hydroxyanthranilate 3,4-dioxygenase [Aneurinibacillus]MED0680365.1 3-hydroxyanthranilate 3,4-dioxygenase [Aneurinibacillus thermoaerophilus]MED0738505.1 3-hydroxyanthranilate 3,4-dioxygenase [Aneurinibacillus thermoaerophilus]MED0757065.1 3-hydroxyanthranilate 3,4-dioxygenase [Aneurinibacillus thermoaerophilus]MED0760457.1 3-hydroxyanthranilate 3,4-dioxygenase [Aneurinibacillus thermoaerophilus]MED0763285.1 3-hydroxyanthranilate 3,4-dioxygenase [Aneurinibacillus thermoaeroph